MTGTGATAGLDAVGAALQRRRAEGLWRELAVRDLPDRYGLLDLASNDYLGLARDPRVTGAAADAALRWGAGATGSRLVTGTTRLHADLEGALAAFVGAPAALVFSSGYLANLGVLGVLGGADTVVVSDADNHASLIDGCRLGRSRTVVVPHGDVEAVREALATRQEPFAVVVTDAVFSVAGDVAPLRLMHRAAREAGAWLLVDEAHALGVLGPGGRGACAAAGISGEPEVVMTLTLSKSLGSMGGAVAAAPEVRDLLVNTARPFIFDTALAPASAAAALAALDVLRGAPELAQRARAAATLLSAEARRLGLQASRPDAAVVSVHVGEPAAALAARDACAGAGVRVGCFRPPSVPPGASCLRLTARADLDEVGLDRAYAALAAVARLLG